MKKKIKEKVIQEKLGPQEIKISYEQDRMIFELGDKQFFLKEEQASFLFGRNVGIRFEQLRADEKEDFTDLNTSDFVAKFRAVNEFYGNLQEAAKYLKIDEQRLKRWAADNDSQRLYNKLAIHDGKFEYEESYKKYRKELFGEEKEEERKPFSPDIRTINKIADLVMEGSNPREIAKEIKVDYGSFISWFTSKEPQQRIQLIINNEISRKESLKNREKHEG